MNKGQIIKAHYYYLIGGIKKPVYEMVEGVKIYKWKAKYLLDMLRNSDITKSYGVFQLRNQQKVALTVQKEDDTTKDIGFVAGDLDYDAMHTFVDGERAFVSGWTDQATGVAEEFEGNDKPEVSHAVEGVCVEKSVANALNNLMAGAVVGTPGTLPTGWVEALRGLTREIVAIDSDSGIPYIDIRFHGTANNNNPVNIRFSSLSHVVAGVGEDWNGSMWMQILDETNAPDDYRFIFAQMGGTAIVSDLTFTPTPTFVRHDKTLATTNVNITHIVLYAGFNVTSGTAYDFTVRIGMPNLIKSSYRTLPIPSSGSAVTRTAPAPVLTDFLPTTGSVAGWVDVVKDNGYLFEGDVSIEIAGDLIIAKVKDQYMFMENPFTWDIYTRKNIGFILSWDATEVIFDVSDGDGNLYRITEDKAYSAITDNDITLGNQTSVYWNIIIKHNG
jgi:hypothetical protein